MSLGRVLRDRRHARYLDAARRGSGDAFRRLYGEVFGPVHGYFATRLRRREDAEDLTSQVFHRFLESLDRFDPARGSVLAWLLTIAHHALVDHLRRVRPHAPLEAAEGLAVDPATGPLEALLREERAGRVRDTVAALPPELRGLFEMRFERGMSHREIALVLGISESAVKQRFSRAQRHVRALLEAEGATRHE